MLTPLTRLFPRSRGLVLFMFALAISAMGLNPAGKYSVTIGVASLLIQIPLYKCITEYVNHNALHTSYLDFLYIISALCQFLIVQIFAPSFLYWFFQRLYLLFPNLVRYFIGKVYVSVEGVLRITEVIARNWVHMLSSTARKVTESYERFRNPASATALLKPLAEEKFVVLLGEAISSLPIFFIIPTEISKYDILTYAVNASPLETFGSRCWKVIVMAMVVSIPIANIEVVTSPHLAADLFGQGEGSKLRVSIRLLAIMGAYVSSMLSCVMLGVRIAENAILGRKYRTWTVRFLSLVFVWIARVLTWFSTFDGDVSVDQQLMFVCTLLVILNGTAFSLWFTVLQLITDEQRKGGPDVRKQPVR